MKIAKQPLKPETNLLNVCKSTLHNKISKTTESSGPKPDVWLKRQNGTPDK